MTAYLLLRSYLVKKSRPQSTTSKPRFVENKRNESIARKKNMPGRRSVPNYSHSSSKSVKLLLAFLVLAVAQFTILSTSNNQRFPPSVFAEAFTNLPSSSPSNHHHHPLSTSTHQSRQTMSTSLPLQSNSDDNSPPLQPIRAGFLGCGTIASSIATGLATPDHQHHLAQNGLSLSSICVTRRSESKSSALKEKFPGVVTVYESAEEVVKNSEIVFLCVLPQHVDGVLADLREKGVWREKEHTLVSLVVSSRALWWKLACLFLANTCACSVFFLSPAFLTCLLKFIIDQLAVNE